MPAAAQDDGGRRKKRRRKRSHTLPEEALSSAVAENVRRARYAFVACVVCGLVQKPLIKFAWDVQAFQAELHRVHKRVRTRGGGEAVLGGTAILLRQVFAAKGQRVVADIAISLAVAGKSWDSAALRRLCRDLAKMEAKDTMKLTMSNRIASVRTVGYF